MGAVYLETDGLLGDALVVAYCALCLIQDFLPDAVKVIEALACTGAAAAVQIYIYIYIYISTNDHCETTGAQMKL